MREPYKILLVDDDPDVLKAISEILESRDYRVVTARDGEQALKKLKDEQPDLMILDLLMPRMDGFAVCKELQDPSWSEYSDMPVLILTAVAEGASRRRYQLETGRTLDVDDYIEKPVDMYTLLDRVAKLLKRHKYGLP
jgi:DNA-binding response OmpR family regulator